MRMCPKHRICTDGPRNWGTRTCICLSIVRLLAALSQVTAKIYWGVSHITRILLCTREQHLLLDTVFLQRLDKLHSEIFPGVCLVQPESETISINLISTSRPRPGAFGHAVQMGAFDARPSAAHQTRQMRPVPTYLMKSRVTCWSSGPETQ